MINPERLISFLVDSDRLFLAVWIVVLGTAFALSFPERWFAPEPAPRMRTRP